MFLGTAADTANGSERNSAWLESRPVRRAGSPRLAEAGGEGVDVAGPTLKGSRRLKRRAGTRSKFGPDQW
jgi:hypothetical protein